MIFFFAKIFCNIHLTKCDVPNIVKGDVVGLGIITIASLVVLGYTDLILKKIPNVILSIWLLTIIFNNIFISTTPVSSDMIVASLLVTGSFLLLKHIVPCSAGDFKLYGLLVLVMGLQDALKILLITLIYSLFPLVSGFKKVPIAFITCFGYIAFLLLRNKGVI